jgi:hypothetical protein
VPASTVTRAVNTMVAVRHLTMKYFVRYYGPVRNRGHRPTDRLGLNCGARSARSAV